MPDKAASREADLEKARLIVAEHGLLIGPAGKMSEIIAKAVADGIALGRKEAIAVATEAVARLKGGSDS